MTSPSPVVLQRQNIRQTSSMNSRTGFPLDHLISLAVLQPQARRTEQMRRPAWREEGFLFSPEQAVVPAG